MDEQSIPEQAGTGDATDEQRIEGLVEQMQADIAEGHVDDAARMLRQRLDDAGIVVDEAEFANLLARLEH